MNGLIQQLNSLGLAQGQIIRASFYMTSALIIFFALRIVTSRNILHSAVFLALTLSGIACIYLFLDAEFLAIVQILIYVGAIVTLFLFAIMLTAKIQDRAIRQVNQQVLISCMAALALFCFTIFIIKINPWFSCGQKEETLSLAQLGSSLMTNYALPFEVISLLLLASLVGVVVIGKLEKR